MKRLLTIAFILAVLPLLALPIPTNIRVDQDDRVATLFWDSFPNTTTGVSGYQVKWGMSEGVLDHTVLVQYPVAQLQPLTNGTSYTAEIRSIDNLGYLSAPSRTILFTGNSTRVDTLRKSMNGFFDDFNLPEGPVNELNWNASWSLCNDPTRNGFFLNDQFHVHSALAALVPLRGDRAQAIARPRAAFDFTNRTGTLVFDFDGAQRRDRWYIDFIPNPLDITGHVGSDDGEQGYPGNMLRLKETNNVVSLVWIDSTGRAKTLVTSPNLIQFGIRTIPNIRRPWEVKLSQKFVSVKVDGKLVCSSAVDLPWSVCYPQWSVVSYNTPKENIPRTFIHWDNFGFDAPEGYVKSTVTHNYQSIGSDGSVFAESKNRAPVTVTVPIPDSLDNASGAKLYFTLQAGAQAYKWAQGDSYSINGVKYLLDEPAGVPALSSYLVSVYRPYSIYAALPLSALKAGDNQVTFCLTYGGAMNVHIEVDYPVGKESKYTPPMDIFNRSMAMNTMPVGAGVRITKINATPVYDILGGTVAESSLKSLSVSGVIDITVEVDGQACLHATGKQAGVSRIEFLIDGVVSSSFLTDAQSPTVSGVYHFMLTTSKLTNGIHELFARAMAPAGVSSIPDYQAAVSKPGDYYPLRISVNNPIQGTL